ncbi:MAG: hypothetical protein ABI451_01985 [Dokdonella sp.]
MTVPHANQRIEASKIHPGWYRQPVVWLGIAIFVASLAGCIWMVVLGSRHADEPLPDAVPSIMKVPLTRSPQPPPATNKPQ